MRRIVCILIGYYITLMSHCAPAYVCIHVPDEPPRWSLKLLVHYRLLSTSTSTLRCRHSNIIACPMFPVVVLSSGLYFFFLWDVVLCVWVCQRCIYQYLMCATAWVKPDCICTGFCNCSYHFQTLVTKFFIAVPLNNIWSVRKEWDFIAC
jgi:hypothetical protein